MIHRDLKPDNVLIGSFGEVLLADWGIAVSLHTDPSGRLPHARESREIAGTPAYMAPEMLGGAVGERTDVYLLGAILHEILVGRPPHGGDGLAAMMISIVLSEPRYPDDVPAELAAIAARAMRPSAEERYASAESASEPRWRRYHSIASRPGASERTSAGAIVERGSRAIVARRSASASSGSSSVRAISASVSVARSAASTFVPATCRVYGTGDAHGCPC